MFYLRASLKAAKLAAQRAAPVASKTKSLIINHRWAIFNTGFTLAVTHYYSQFDKVELHERVQEQKEELREKDIIIQGQMETIDELQDARLTVIAEKEALVDELRKTAHSEDRCSQHLEAVIFLYNQRMGEFTYSRFFGVPELPARPNSYNLNRQQAPHPSQDEASAVSNEGSNNNIPRK